MSSCKQYCRILHLWPSSFPSALKTEQKYHTKNRRSRSVISRKNNRSMLKDINIGSGLACVPPNHLSTNQFTLLTPRDGRVERKRLGVGWRTSYGKWIMWKIPVGARKVQEDSLDLETPSNMQQNILLVRKTEHWMTHLDLTIHLKN